MFNQRLSASRAHSFRKQHLEGKLLILPNIWDAMGARLMEKIGFPSVATASVATAITNGYQDGEHIPYSLLLKIVGEICSAIELPVTVDIERGFAHSIPQLKENIRLLIEQGAVGINLEDSKPNHRELYSLSEQCMKIEAVRETGVACGVPLVINARTDVFMIGMEDKAVPEGITRGRAYKAAGADCVYPVTIGSYEEITRFVQALEMPVNVLLMKSIADLNRLKEIGVSRVSLGPNLLSHVITVMKEVAEGLIQNDSTRFFSKELISREFRDSLAFLTDGKSE